MASEQKNISRLFSYVNSAASILQQYEGSQPVAAFLKRYFSQHQKHGSRDRRQIAQLCYSFFRLGRSYSGIPLAEKILLGIKYGAAPPDEDWQCLISKAGIENYASPDNIFPWKNELSASIDATAFESAHRLQPDVFLRIRPGKNKWVRKKLQQGNIDFSVMENTVRLNAAVDINTLLTINQDVVVQDLSSQKTSEFLLEAKTYFGDHFIPTIYDCCAASGGKSIMAVDIFGKPRLTVSDIRPSIIANFKKRMAQAGIKNFRAFVTDLTTPKQAPQQYDLVIADVPCTGSGTWARTPEQLYFFDEKKIAEFAALQYQIIQNVAPAVKPGGLLLYITCSAFSRENEAQLPRFARLGLLPLQQKIIHGYYEKADTMFVALLKKTEPDNNKNPR